MQAQAGADFDQQAVGRRYAHRRREAPRPHGQAGKRLALGRRVAPAHEEVVRQGLGRGCGHADAHAAGRGGVVAGDDPGAAALLLDHQGIGHGHAAGKNFQGQRVKMEGEPQHDKLAAGFSGKGFTMERVLRAMHFRTHGNAGQECTTASTGAARRARRAAPACGIATITGWLTGPPRRLRMVTASPSAAGSSSKRSAAGERSCAARA